MEPAAAPTPSRPKRNYRAAYITLAVAVLLLGAAGWILVRSQGWMSYWNGPDDWRGAAVVPTTLEQRGWRKYVMRESWQNIPFDPAPAEVRDLGRCRQLAARRGVLIDGVSPFLDEAVGTELQGILANRPTLFYARYVLGRWHAARGDHERAEALTRQAYADAPRVLVQRYEYADGTPAAGRRVASFEIEHNRVKNGAIDPSLLLGYWDLTTDDRGCIYLPAYDTVYRPTSMGSPDGLPTTYPRLGWFLARGKVGELPVAVVAKP